MAAKNLLLSGASGAGKSTLLAAICRRMSGYAVRGLISEAIIEHGEQTGWRLETLRGDGGVLAHLDLSSDRRMGKFGVDLELFERLALQELQYDSRTDLFVVDEIGIIASWSSVFQTTFDRLLDSPATTMASIRWKPTLYGDKIRRRLDVECIELEGDHHADIENYAVSWIERRRAAKQS